MLEFHNPKVVRSGSRLYSQRSSCQWAASQVNSHWSTTSLQSLGHLVPPLGTETCPNSILRSDLSRHTCIGDRHYNIHRVYPRSEVYQLIHQRLNSFSELSSLFDISQSLILCISFTCPSSVSLSMCSSSFAF